MDKEPALYIEKGFTGMEKVFLPDDEYARAIEAFIVTCVDTIIIDRYAKKVYLPKRRSKPAQDLWWVIGGRRKTGITAREAMREIFKRETSLEIPLERFVFVAIAEYLWSNRQQSPQKKGVHMQGYTFAVDLTPEERSIVAKNLDPKEYSAELELRAFTLEELQDGSHHPAVVAIAARALQ
ncbi:MAG: hypothetical protein WCT41_02700 [Candidatus Paceibacterota bacterium]|jgi:ADP-ribose pyrophosphatase YjhB (NUDIX family)